MSLARYITSCIVIVADSLRCYLCNLRGSI